MKVNEIYHSIQGESTYAGCPCTFVRLTYCHLRCSYCDSTYAFFEGSDLTLEEILSQVEAYGGKLIEITGGEPLLQAEVFPLMELLLERGYTVLLETSGCVDIGGVDPRVIKIMDLKCPGSGESEKNLFSNIDALQPSDEIKFVVGSREDYEWAKRIMMEHQLSGRFTILISTVFGAIEPRDVVEWMLADHLRARFQLQLHKYIWPAETRGV
jgi:7-carboxy-7-deazaguanine synthase